MFYNTGIGFVSFDLEIVLGEGTAETSVTINFTLAPVDNNLFYSATGVQFGPQVFLLGDGQGNNVPGVFCESFYLKVRYWSGLPSTTSSVAIASPLDSLGNIRVDVQATAGVQLYNNI